MSALSSILQITYKSQMVKFTANVRCYVSYWWTEVAVILTITVLLQIRQLVMHSITQHYGNSERHNSDD